MARRRITDKMRVAIFNHWNGICHICGGKIDGKGWDVEHVIPLAQGGEDGGDNLRPAHRKCHGEKTKQDAADTARAKRREIIHLGAKAPSPHPIPSPPRAHKQRAHAGRQSLPPRQLYEIAE